MFYDNVYNVDYAAANAAGHSMSIRVHSVRVSVNGPHGVVPFLLNGGVPDLSLFAHKGAATSASRSRVGCVA